MTNEEKVKKLYEAYLIVDDQLFNSEHVYRLCELLAAKLTPSQVNHLVNYMTHEEYPAIYEAVQEALSIVAKDAVADLLQPQDEDSDPLANHHDPNKFGVN